MSWFLLACKSCGSVFMDKTWAGLLLRLEAGIPSTASVKASVSHLKGSVSSLTIWVFPNAELEAGWLWNPHCLLEWKHSPGVKVRDFGLLQVCVQVCLACVIAHVLGQG